MEWKKHTHTHTHTNTHTHTHTHTYLSPLSELTLISCWWWSFDWWSPRFTRFSVTLTDLNLCVFLKVSAATVVSMTRRAEPSRPAASTRTQTRLLTGSCTEQRRTWPWTPQWTCWRTLESLSETEHSWGRKRSEACWVPVSTWETWLVPVSPQTDGHLTSTCAGFCGGHYG